MHRHLQLSNCQGIRVSACLLVAACALVVLAGCASRSAQAASPTGSPVASALETATPSAATPGPSLTAPLPTATPHPTSTPPSRPLLEGDDVLPAPLYFVSHTQITRIERDGKTRTAVVEPAGEQFKGFDVSPVDGSIVLASLGRLWLARAGQQEPEVLLTGLPDPESTDGFYEIRDPVWSPDGKQIAYVDGGLYVLDVASGRRLDLAELPTFGDAEFGIPWRLHAESYWQPRWSPRGDAILFQRQTPDYYMLMLATLANGEVCEVPGTFVVHQEDAAWSSDGTALLFGYDAPVVAPIPDVEPSFVRMTLADLQARVLCSRESPLCGSPSKYVRQVLYPFQAADGRILYFKEDGCDHDFCNSYSLVEGMITQDGFDAHVLLENILPSTINEVKWHESGKYAVFLMGPERGPTIALLRVDTGEIFTVSREEYPTSQLRWGKQ